MGCRTQLWDSGLSYGVWHHQRKLWDQALAVGWGVGRDGAGTGGQQQLQYRGHWAGLGGPCGAGCPRYLPVSLPICPPRGLRAGITGKAGTGHCPEAPGAAEGVRDPGTCPLPARGRAPGHGKPPCPGQLLETLLAAAHVERRLLRKELGPAGSDRPGRSGMGPGGWVGRIWGPPVPSSPPGLRQRAVPARDFGKRLARG